MQDVMALIAEKRIVPVVKLDNAQDALPLAEALLAGGLPVAEITFRTDAAEEAIRLIRNTYPQMLCGAGTIVNAEQAKRAKDAGAAFFVSPGFSASVVNYAKEVGVPILPGCCTPTEIMMAMDAGLSIVKFFPAGQYGGLKTIKALAAPFPGIRFMPTGGVSAANLKEYLGEACVYACGGSWMVSDKLIQEKRFDEIRKLTEEAVALAAGR